MAKSALPDPAILDRLEELCRNCYLGKYRHFNAAMRAKRINDGLGIPVVLINIGVGSVFFVAVSKEVPAFAMWCGGFLALTAAMISGIATFFNFGKQFEGHRGVANKYVKVASKCENAVARYRDGLADLKGIDRLLQEFQEQYMEVNEEAKAYPTTEHDFKLALQRERIRTQALRERHAPNAGSQQSTTEKPGSVAAAGGEQGAAG